MSEPRERPIIFSSEMVRAILDGRKTQTRRVIRNPERLSGLMLEGEAVDWCPYGRPGDLLYVREAWRPRWTPERGHILRYRADGSDSPEDGALASRIAEIYSRRGSPDHKQPWRPSIHMPKWAARIWLEVTAVRVERVQEISVWDARDEGVQVETHPDGGIKSGYIDGFRKLWDSINADRAYGWEENPWCWVVSFKRVMR